jgi:hypothetical protein
MVNTAAEYFFAKSGFKPSSSSDIQICISVMLQKE